MACELDVEMVWASGARARPKVHGRAGAGRQQGCVAVCHRNCLDMGSKEKKSNAISWPKQVAPLPWLLPKKDCWFDGEALDRGI